MPNRALIDKDGNPYWLQDQFCISCSSSQDNPAKFLFCSPEEYEVSPAARHWEIPAPKRYPAILVVYEYEHSEYPSVFFWTYVELRDFEALL